MPRYHNEFKFSNPIHPQLFADIHQYMLSEGYEYRNFEGENVYKKGKGFSLGPTFLKIMADQDRIVVEAWIKFAVVPGVYAGEMGIDGVFGAVPKSMLSGRVRNVERMITSNGGVATGATVPAPGAAPQPQQQTYAQPPVQPPMQPQPPVQPQPTPVEPQPAPIEPQPAPVEPQPAPIEPQQATVEPQPAPIEPQPAPIEPQPTPVEPQQAPVEPQQKREHIFCTRCGNKMPISASFCTSCGNKLK